MERIGLSLMIKEFQRKCHLIENGKKEAGTYSIVWDGKDNRNMEMASGVYVFVLKLDDKIISKKFTLIR